MLTIALRLLHVVAGAIWTGGAVIIASYVVPSIQAAGPAGGAVMREIAFVRKLPIHMTILGFITVLAGFALYGLNARGTGWGGTNTGMTFGIGGLFGLTALLLGAFWSRPTANKIAALGAKMQSAGSPPPAALMQEMQGLQATLGKALRVVALCAVLAAVAMSVARYL
ncbi:MAG: hypothetical protein U0132_01985 [Gemmatimonadaceae bacterium]